MKLRIVSYNKICTGDTAHSLRNDRRDCCARAAPMERHDAEYVEQDIQHCRYGKEDKGRTAVADGPQDACHVVVEQCERHSQEDDEDVDPCVAVNVGRCVQNSQNLRCEKNTQSSHDGCHRTDHPDAVINSASYSCHVPGAEITRQRDAYSCAAAGAEAENKKLYGSCSTYRREGVRSKETRYDCGVCQTVGLLQQVAQKKRKCECEYQPQRASFGHVFHQLLIFPPFIIVSLARLDVEFGSAPADIFQTNSCISSRFVSFDRIEGHYSPLYAK